MYIEKTHQESLSRTIRTKPGRGRVYMEDNRPEAVRQAKMIDVIQRRENVIQRDAFWPVNAQNKAKEIEPQANQPKGGRYIWREGGNLNHRLYSTENSARKAARKDAGWSADGALTSRYPEEPKNGAGVYQYNYRIVNQEDQVLTKNSPLMAEHVLDGNSVLELVNNGIKQKDKCKHCHSAIAQIKADIGGPGSHKEQPKYNQAGVIEHYFINPF